VLFKILERIDRQMRHNPDDPPSSFTKLEIGIMCFIVGLCIGIILIKLVF